MLRKPHILLTSIYWSSSRSATSTTTSTKANRKSVPDKMAKTTQQQQSRPPIVQKKAISIEEFPLTYPDFLPSQVWNRRDPLFHELTHADMLERRMVIDIPEFYVGSILAVTMSDPNTPNRKNRFVGICIRREKEGLKHNFTLRNMVDGLGVEIMYEMYNPTLLAIEVLLLEKRLDQDLTYLVDALPEYSTFDFNMESVAHPGRAAIPVNPLKVKLKSPPWARPWFELDIQGIEDAWTEATPWFKRKFIKRKDLFDLKKFDLIRHYREAAQELEHDLEVQKRIIAFERGYGQREGATHRRIFKSASDGMKEITLNVSSSSEDHQ